MQSKFMAAINQLASEKNLPKEKVVDIVTHALRAAYRKDYGNREQNIKVALNEDTAIATVYLIKEVIGDDDELEFPDRQATVKEAKKFKKDAKVGDIIEMDVTPADYGRIAAQSAKQVIIQRIQEAEKDIITDMYKDREHEILNGYINRVEGPNVYVDLDRTQAILRPQDQIRRENYHNGQRIKVYLEKVIASPKGPRLLISRSHPKLVNCLLELEIPEVREKVVEIQNVAREAGVRSKVTVTSSDPNVDPIGACVGQKGVRIQSIMEEFNGERIDIIQHSEDEIVMLNAALAPAKISHIELNEETKRAQVFVPVEERALAIGKGGQNVRLASMLTGWEIDIMDLEKLDTAKLDEVKKKEVEQKLKGETAGPKAKQAKVEMPVAAEDIKDLPGMTDDVASKLEAAGFMKSIQLMGLNAAAMTAIEGITQEEAEMVEQALKGPGKKEVKEEGDLSTSVEMGKEGEEEEDDKKEEKEEKPKKAKKAKKAKKDEDLSTPVEIEKGEEEEDDKKEEKEEKPKKAKKAKKAKKDEDLSTPVEIEKGEEEEDDKKEEKEEQPKKAKKAKKAKKDDLSTPVEIEKEGKDGKEVEEADKE
jgi:N utilization substance protein A